MFLLRRTAVGAFTQQPLRLLAPVKSASARVTYLQPVAARSFHQSRLWLAEEDKSKVDEASPAEVETTGETIPTEASQAEAQVANKDVVEKSIATPEVPEATTSQSSERQTIAGKAQEFASSAAETVQTAASSASQSVRNAFSSKPAASSSTASSEFQAPRQPAAMAPGGVASAGLGRTNNPPSRIIYIGNLFFEVTAPHLEEHFRKFGEITNSRIVTDSRGLSKGFGYLEFATQEAADNAVQQMDQTVFQGRRMAVQYHMRRDSGNNMGPKPPRQPHPPSKTLFIGNMSYQMSDRDLNDLFREIRNVLDVRVAIDRRSGQPRGFAHADFVDVASAERAKRHLEQKVIYGRQLKVDFSESAPSTRQTE